MKQLLLALSVVAVSATASAGTCFNFVNGKGPSQIANYKFAATATQVCFSKNRDGASVTFCDSEGDLAIFSAVEQSTGRCAGFCKSLGLSYGNVNGSNADARGALLSINAEQDYTTRSTQGSLSLQTSRSLPEKFLVMQAQ